MKSFEIWLKLRGLESNCLQDLYCLFQSFPSLLLFVLSQSACGWGKLQIEIHAGVSSSIFINPWFGWCLQMTIRAASALCFPAAKPINVFLSAKLNEAFAAGSQTVALCETKRKTNALNTRFSCQQSSWICYSSVLYCLLYFVGLSRRLLESVG